MKKSSKVLKKWTALLLSALMMTASVPAFQLSAFAAETEKSDVGAASGTSGDCTWTLSDDGTLTISGNGALPNYVLMDDLAPWSEYEFTKLVVEEGVTRLGFYSFYNCSSLVQVELPESLEYIGVSAFCECESLSSIYIPKNVTYIDDSVLADCNNLTSIIVDEQNPKYDSRKNCNAIIETDTNTLIQGCNVTKIPGSVTAIADWAFLSCKKLTEIALPKKLESIGGSAFAHCEKLENLIIPNSVKSIGSTAFDGCTNLKNVKLPYDLNTLEIYTFYRCKNLETVTIPQNLTKIENYAFYLEGSFMSLTKSIKDVYYQGTQESWNNITVGSLNANLTTANIHFITLGDADSSGSVNIVDCTAIQKYLVGLSDMTNEQLAAADANGDGDADILDVTHLQLYLADFDVVLGKSHNF